ncbi:MAG: FecR domain-containing protein, partial [Polyangiaceae bacterium]|nr:FecR domain-containing protein [Polyangiaceae bacterium]
MSTTESKSMCAEIEERLSEVLDGTAPASFYDHIAECDACRDKRHEASKAAELVASASADFRAPSNFAEQLLAKVEAARPLGPVAQGGADSKAAAASTKSSSAAAPAGAEKNDAALATNPTVLAPAVAENVTQRSAESAKASEPKSAKAAGDPSAPVQPTLPASGPVGATTHHGAKESSSGERVTPEVRATEPEKKTDPAAVKTGTKVVPLFKRPAIVAGIVGALAAAAAAGIAFRGKSTDKDAPVFDTPWAGKVAAVSRASADKSGGFEACDASGACSVVATGAEIKPGSKLRTDARTRAHVTLADGTAIALDRATSIELSAGKERTARLDQGTVVAEVTKSDGALPARFLIPQGEVEVLGTKLALTASEDRASVEVARGSVRLRSGSGKWKEVRAGEEATIERDGDAVIASSTSLADVMEWSDRTPEEIDAPVLRGLGELRARKPGQTKERDRAVRLAKHSVKVRIVDVVARTEVDETFANDTDEELEGIFRFPLPPGAQIERLALEVDGKLLDGAFVDRDRGAAIWRGVIQNAAPKAPKPREEIIWVPGPWRDPALLEWQRGGRFELRIFPIPKRGSRRVVLTYTQVVDQAAGVRRFTYPLAHDASGTTKIDSFDMDVQVLGHDKEFGIQTRGYELATGGASDGAAERRTLSSN